MDAMASQITSISRVYSAVCSGVYQRKHQSSSLAFVREIHRSTMNSPRSSNAENVSIWWRHHETGIRVLDGDYRNQIIHASHAMQEVPEIIHDGTELPRSRLLVNVTCMTIVYISSDNTDLNNISTAIACRRHHMEMHSTLLTLCERNPPVTGGFTKGQYFWTVIIPLL